MASVAEMITKANNSKEFIELKKYYKKKSFMQIVGCARLEIQHSNFIAWLLNPNGGHNLNYKPIEKFLSMVAVCKENNVNDGIEYDEDFLSNFINETLKIEDVRITTERAVSMYSSDKKRIDIELLVELNVDGKNFTLPVIIENKVKSKEHDKQTKYYYDWAKKQYANEKYLTPLFIYLSPDINDKPECDEYIRLNYQDLIDNFIQPLYLICSDEHSKFLIEDYLRCLSYTSEDSMISEKGDIIMGYTEKELKLLHEFWDKNKDLIYAVAKSLGEEEKEELKPILDGVKDKDYSRYKFNGIEYNKRKLVFAIVEAYVKKVKGITYSELLEVFPDKLHLGSLGVIKKKDDIKDATRYFEKPILLDDTEVYVCNQWGKDNIEVFINSNHGFTIEKL